MTNTKPPGGPGKPPIDPNHVEAVYANRIFDIQYVDGTYVVTFGVARPTRTATGQPGPIEEVVTGRTAWTPTAFTSMVQGGGAVLEMARRQRPGDEPLPAPAKPH